MKRLTREQQKTIVQQWKRAAPALARARREELAHWKYDARIVDALLDIGAKAPRKEEEPNGLVEMQRRFMEIARKQGLLPAVREAPTVYATAAWHTLGNVPFPPGPKLALLCSVKCPGKLILDTYDLCQRFRAEGITVVSGFHSPMEQECLRILLRSPHPVIWCLARGMLRRVPATPVDCRPAVHDGRLVIASPFPDKVRHVTSKTAMARNRFVAGMATAVVVAHAAPGSKMESLCRDLLAAGKPLYTFAHSANAAIINAGAKPITPDTNWKRLLTAETA
jgi:predicted Rossmann fold nucleotide-binding protein DprA/Smf involved in DNA uptake